MQKQQYKKEKNRKIPSWFPGIFCNLQSTVYNLERQRGVTLIELLITVIIIIVIVFVLGKSQADIFVLQNTIRDSLSVQQDVRSFLKTIVAELRSAQSSDAGGYLLDSATATFFVFYSDLDGNGTRERLRYFIEGTNLKKGVTTSVGSPPSYLPATEQVSAVVTNLISTSTPIFSFYAAGYIPSNTPLPFPVDIAKVRLVKIQVSADVNPNRSPGVITGVSAVSIRNLKENL